MFHTPDTETLRLCSVLASTAFGLVFALVRFGRRIERHFVHWSASAFLYAAVLIGFELARGNLVLVASLLGALAATNMLIISGLRSFDGRGADGCLRLSPAVRRRIFCRHGSAVMVRSFRH
jgi:hypothetical protein